MCLLLLTDCCRQTTGAQLWLFTALSVVLGTWCFMTALFMPSTCPRACADCGSLGSCPRRTHALSEPPVSIGRRVFQLALGRRVHEVYSFGVGVIVLCAFAIAVRLVRHAMTNLTLSRASARAVVVGVRGPSILGRNQKNALTREGSGHPWHAQAARVAYVVATVGVLLPYLAGYLFELVIIAPLAVDAEEMPILFPLQVRPAPCTPKPTNRVFFKNHAPVRRTQTWPLGTILVQTAFQLVQLGPQWPVRDLVRTVRGRSHFR